MSNSNNIADREAKSEARAAGLRKICADARVQVEDAHGYWHSGPHDPSDIKALANAMFALGGAVEALSEYVTQEINCEETP